MALGIKSIAAIVGLSVAGIGAVSGIGYGIHVATTSQHIETNEIKTDSSKPTSPKPNKPSTSSNSENENKTDDLLNDQPVEEETNAPISLEEIEKQLKTKDLVIKETTGEFKEVKKDTTYAYKVLSNKFEFKDSSELLKGIESQINVSESKNTLDSYSEGKLHLEVKLIRTSDDLSTDKTRTFELEVSGFKTADNELKKLLSEENTDKYVLDLTKSAIKNTSLTIEDLNKETEGVNLPKKDKEPQPDPKTKKASGLTDVFWNTDLKTKNDQLYLGDFVIEGQVKLKQVKKEDSLVSFYLVSNNEKTPLRIVGKENEEQKEVLISQIKVANLVPSFVNVTLKDTSKENQKLLEAIKKNEDSNHLGYFSKDVKEIDLNNLWINLKEEANKPAHKLYLNAYIVKESDLKMGKLPVQINLSFGSGNEAFIVNNDQNEIFEALKQDGYVFDLYSKKIGTENKPEIKASDIKASENSLTTYFKENGNKFVEKVDKTKPQPDNKTVTGGFYRESFDQDKLKNIELNLQDSIGANDLSDLPNRLPSNFLVFASFTNTKNKGEDKVSYSEYVTIIHVEKTEKAK